MASLYRMGIEARPRPRLADGYGGWQANGIDAILATDVIPKLLLACAPDAPSRVDRPALSASLEAEQIATLSISSEAHVLLDRIDALMARGLSTEQVLVELLAPAARHLGRGWDNDDLDLLQVSMGLWRLQEVMRELTARSHREHSRLPDRAALFMAMPGEDHSFGAAMVQECFALAGWQSDLLLGGSKDDLLDYVADTHVDVVGLTISCDSHIGRLPSLIRAVRTVSMNSRLRVIIGGRVPDLHPGLVGTAGADGTAPSAIAAVVLAEEMVDSARALAAG